MGWHARARRDHPRSNPIVWLAIAVLVATACGTSAVPSSPPGSMSPSGGGATPASPATPTAAASPSVETTPRPAGSYAACDNAAAAPYRLVVRDQEPHAGTGEVLDQLNIEFEAANPGIEILRQPESTDDLAHAILADLAQPDGPDISQVPNGREGLGAAVAAGLLLPLDAASQAYAWDERWAPRTLARLSARPDGSILGEGLLYGVPLTGEISGLLFNDTVGHTRPDFEVPYTLDETVLDLTRIRDAGVVPVLVGGSDGGLVLLYGSILGTLVTPEWLDAFVYGRPGSTFDTPETVEAATRLRALAKEKLLAKGFATTSTAEAYEAFLADKAQYLVGGSWQWPALVATGRAFKVVRLRPLTPGGTELAVGGTGLPFVIRATTAHPACAAAYLDFLTGDHAMELIAATALALPSHVSAAALGSDPWYRDMSFWYRDTESGDQLGHRLELAFPTGADALQENLVALMRDTLTPAQFAERVDEAYQAALGRR